MTDNAQHSGHAAQAPSQPAPLDASKLKVNLTTSLKPVPSKDEMVLGKNMTDHMLVITYHPVTGWSDPEIKPYGPLSLDPASSCFHYSTNLFEGMKAYLGPDGKPRLFRPDMNMARMHRSRARVALPEFDTAEFQKLIEQFVLVESRWIPSAPGYSLYLRPTIIGTRPFIGVAPSDHAMLYVIACPTGPSFRVAGMLSLKAVNEHVRAWPGGTGGYKLAGNYAPTFMPQAEAAKEGYDQVLWCLEDNITEAGAMNFFAVLKRGDGDLDVVTPPIDGTILPGVTRDSVLALLRAHGSETTLPGLSATQKIHTHERNFTLTEAAELAKAGHLLETFTVGTAVVVASVGSIGVEGRETIQLPKHEGAKGPVARAIYDRITAIQEGREQWRDWSVVCQ